MYRGILAQAILYIFAHYHYDTVQIKTVHLETV